jgi:hypothetical protein
MALQLSKNTTSILVQGTDIELASIYVRIVFTCNLDGSITVTYKTYQNADAYLAGKEIATDVINMTYNYVILETETQSLNTALLYMQNEFINLGYNAIVV